MKKDKNLKVHVILKNLIVVTEDSEEDITFKLPMYKYLQNNFDEMITKELSEEFNDNFQVIIFIMLEIAKKSAQRKNKFIRYLLEDDYRLHK